MSSWAIPLPRGHSQRNLTNDLEQTFLTSRDRDAWATIRGYVYQVDSTVDRWLDLLPGQVLELERGEDIDLVSLVAPSEPAEQQRVLEQIKHLETSITLRHGSVIASLANFVEHRTMNPDLDLYFRLSTNARIGRERLSPLAGRKLALEVWEQVRAGRLTGEEREAAVRGLRALLASAPQPSGLTEVTWERYRAYAETSADEAIEDLIRRFEVAAAKAQANQLALHILAKLMDQGHAATPEEALEQYHRLFLRVLKVLSASGLKRLDSKQRDERLSRPIAAEDRVLLRRLVSQLDALELRTEHNELAIRELAQSVEVLAKQQRVDIAIAYTRLTPTIELPPGVDRVSHRDATVMRLATLVTSHAWTAIHGGMGFGKSQLAILLARRLGAPAAWISLDGLTDEEACLHLDLALAKASSLALEPSPTYDAISQRLAGWLVVLDGLPNLLTNPRLGRRLLALSRAADAAEVRLLSTSPFPLPAAVERAAARCGLIPLEIPPFTDEEAAELLAAHGAPPYVVGAARFINTLAQVHPLMITAISAYLEARSWRMTEAELEGLFRGDYKSRLDQETFTRITSTVVDDQTRDLLYRLDLVLGDFTLDQVRVVAAAEPIIVRPGERLNRLLGLWVQRRQGERLRLSPLLSGTFKNEVPQPTQQRVYLALAEGLLGRRRLNQHEVADLFLYLVQARDIRRAGTVLLMALSDLLTHLITTYDGPLLYVWVDQPLPGELDLGHRIYLRALQIALRQQAEKDVVPLILDLDEMAAQATGDEAWALLGAGLHAAPVMAKHSFSAADRLMRMAFALLPEGRLPLPPGVEADRGKLPPEQPLEWLLWLYANEFRNCEEAEAWLETVESLTPAQRERAFSGTLSDEGSKLVTSRLWSLEADRAEDERNWPAVVATLRRFASVAEACGLGILYACAEHGLIVVTAEYLGDLKGARTIADEALEQVGASPAASFLIRECIGRQYLYKGHAGEAIRWLEQALTHQPDSFGLERIDAMLALARALGDSSAAQAAAWIEDAVGLARSQEATSGVPLIRALGELSIARWRLGDMDSAFEALDQAAERLLAIKDESRHWKGLFATLGHVSGFLASIAKTGAPPVTTMAGEKYVAPEPGFFAAHYAPRSALYREDRLSYLYAQLTTFAAAVGRSDRSAKWTIEGIELARQHGQGTVLAGFVMEGATTLLANHQYEELLELAVDGGRIIVATAELHRQGRSQETDSDDPDVELILGQKPSELWARADDIAVGVVHLPTLFHLALLFLEDGDLARRHAERVTRLYRDAAAANTQSPFWGLAEVVEVGFADEPAGRELLRRCKSGGPWADGDYLQATGYVLATLQPDITLAEKAHLHAACFGYVHDKLDGLGYGPLAYRDIVVPFISSYWSTAFERQRFRFRTPKLVESSLLQALEEPVERRVKAILRVIVPALPVTPSGGVSEWLSS
ncbi:MAG: hypothetical protein WD942_11350 [Dehalococcoidia bacterium]